ncbi:arsenical resistance operon trans-acting repressor ArsD [Neobacillus bataviensis]|uniref:Arsenical resistance operon trans-acting repressor ArsD n=1 Tax=Neobacillus bataviensis TaxID=220685 RepID=A0A561CKW5_9BACI|nr:arsenite efflux transporter metallochaperone ArsD [Neobacillus bataviensis]TWD91637.1 arsenical resistance operon trans-acting repressor ArsD [Neobacillus bataviensis]
MNKVEIFDPALCCATGVCGPSVDPELTRVATAIFLLEKKGYDIKRYNLGFEPAIFVENKEVSKVLHEKGPNSLPITLVEGEIAKIGTYPTNDEFAEWFGVQTEELSEKPKPCLTIDLKPSK